MDALLKPREVKEKLQVSLSFVYTLIRTGELSCVKLGGKAVRVRQVDLEAYIESHLSGGKNGK